MFLLYTMYCRCQRDKWLKTQADNGNWMYVLYTYSVYTLTSSHIEQQNAQSHAMIM
jgi:hypothetical protein